MVKNNNLVMAGNKTNLWVVVGVALVVGLVAGVIGAGISGNIVKVPTSVATTQTNVYTTKEVYNKTETDKRIGLAITTLLNNVIADEILEPLLYLKANHTQEVLTMFRDKCIITSPVVLGLGVTNGKKVCETYNAKYNKLTTCVLAEAVKGSSSQVVETLTCDLTINTGIWAHVMCCSP